MPNINEAELTQTYWSITEIPTLLLSFTNKIGLSTLTNNEFESSTSFLAQFDKNQFNEWLQITSLQNGYQAKPIHTSYNQIDKLLINGPPCLIRLPTDQNEPAQFIAIVSSNKNSLTLLTPDETLKKIPIRQIKKILSASFENPLIPSLDQLLDTVDITKNQQEIIRQELLSQQLKEIKIDGIWLLEQSPNTTIYQQFKRLHLWRYFAALLTGQSILQILTILGWSIIGYSSIANAFDWSWLLAWILLLITIIVFQWIIKWAESLLVVFTGNLFKKHLLNGSLNLDLQLIHKLGVGDIMGRVMEIESVELLALGGGLTAIISIVELISTALVLSRGAGGWRHSAIFIGWIGIACVLIWRFIKYNNDWVDQHQKMVRHLTEQIIGHKTRLVQEYHEYWHNEEDKLLFQYLFSSNLVDQKNWQLHALIPKGWLIIGLLGIMHPFIFKSNQILPLAISIGGILLGSQALTKLVSGITSLAALLKSWTQIKPLLKSATLPLIDSELNPSYLWQQATHYQENETLILGENLYFKYLTNRKSVLANTKLKINNNARILLQGDSGSGKSTLGNLIAGLYQPDSGLFLLQGFDHHTMGQFFWRQQISSVLQFNNNHLFSHTLAFNLLLGRNWPPTQEDLSKAETICRELGLGELIDQMPNKLHQQVGERGWQLSQGERSRIYIARALLQEPLLLILDESLSALDPENFNQTLDCINKHAQALILIAHQ